MLESFDLTQAIGKADYQKRIAPLERKMGELQRRIREIGIPVIVVFEGWEAAGKGTLINALILSMDPRGFNVYSTHPPVEEERLRPFLWRFWTKTPERGRIALFDRSWYGRVLGDRVEKMAGKKEIALAYEEINSFERQLVEDGAVIVKYFLHISKKEQKRRFEKLSTSPATAWRVTKEDWRTHKQYGKYLAAAEDILSKTSTAAAPWNVVEAHDQRFAEIKTFSVLVEALERAIAAVGKEAATAAITPQPRVKKAAAAVGSILDRCDISLSMTAEEYNEQLSTCRRKMWGPRARMLPEEAAGSRCIRGMGRGREGRRDQASRRGA